MRFNPKIQIKGISQEIFQIMRLCDAICSYYHVPFYISYVNKDKEFAFSTRNMHGNMWSIMEDIVQFIDSGYEVVDNFTNVTKSPQILIRRVD